MFVNFDGIVGDSFIEPEIHPGQVGEEIKSKIIS